MGRDRGGNSLIDLPVGSPLRDLARSGPALVIFLRSFGCTFCREAMADVARIKNDIRAAGAQLAFVHGATPAEARPWFAKYGLEDVAVISDPDRAHYRAFGLGRTHVGELVNPAVWARGARCALSHGFGTQTPEMMRQLPGVFVLRDGRIVAEYRHRSPADRPNYLELVRSMM